MYSIHKFDTAIIRFIEKTVLAAKGAVTGMIASNLAVSVVLGF